MFNTYFYPFYIQFTKEANYKKWHYLRSLYVILTANSMQIIYLKFQRLSYFLILKFKDKFKSV